MQAKKQRTCGDGATERTASVYKKRRRLNCWHIRCAEARTVYEFTNHFLFMLCTGERGRTAVPQGHCDTGRTLQRVGVSQRTNHHTCAKRRSAPKL
jgi:hypothetical protein